MERDGSSRMSGSGERFQTQIPSTRSAIGLVLRLQVISPLLIFITLLMLRDVISMLGHYHIIATYALYALYPIGFLQLIVLRALLQKEKYSIYAAAILAALVSLFSMISTDPLSLSIAIDSLYRPVEIALDWRWFPYFLLWTNSIINLVSFSCFVNIHWDGGIKSAFLSKDKDSSQ